MAKDAKFEYRVAPLPVPEEGAPRASALGEGDNVIVANTKHPKEAFRFVEYMYQQMPRVWNEFGYMPAYPVTVEKPNYPQAYEVFSESMKFARNRGRAPIGQRFRKPSRRLSRPR